MSERQQPDQRLDNSKIMYADGHIKYKSAILKVELETGSEQEIIISYFSSIFVYFMN